MTVQVDRRKYLFATSQVAVIHVDLTYIDKPSLNVASVRKFAHGQDDTPQLTLGRLYLMLLDLGREFPTLTMAWNHHE